MNRIRATFLRQLYGPFHLAIAVAATVLATSLEPAAGAAAPLPVYGGPTYSPSAGGFIAEFYGNGTHPSAHVNNAGTAVATATKLDASGAWLNYRAVRWSASSAAVELGGGSGSFSSVRADGINAAGTITGSVWVPGGDFPQVRPARWTGSNPAATVLEHPVVVGGSFSYANTFLSDINDSGTAVGTVWRSYRNLAGTPTDQGTRAGRWNAAGTALTELGGMGADVNGLSYASAKAINAAGVAVGEVSKYDASGTPIGNVAVRWDASGVAATELGHLGADAPIGYGSSRAFAINSSGTVLGTQNVYDESGNYLKNVPVRWDATGAPTELGTLDSSNTTTVVSSPAALNDAGVAVGWANKRGVDHLLGERAVRWDASSSAAIELGTLTPSVYGIMYSQASAVNDAGTVVGWSDKYDPTGMTWLGERAVYWGADTIAIDLNTLIDPSSGWLLTHALEISDTGWIVGEGMFDADGVGGRAAYSRHFLMQVPATVPEPGVLSFFGLLLPALLRRRTARRRLPIAAHHLSDAEIAPLKIGR